MGAVNTEQGLLLTGYDVLLYRQAANTERRRQEWIAEGQRKQAAAKERQRGWVREMLESKSRKLAKALGIAVKLLPEVTVTDDDLTTVDMWFSGVERTRLTREMGEDIDMRTVLLTLVLKARYARVAEALGIAEERMPVPEITDCDVDSVYRF